VRVHPPRRKRRDVSALHHRYAIDLLHQYSHDASLVLQIYLDFIDDSFASLQDKRLAADAAKKKFTVAK
jgi:hypothetical protein